MNCKKCDAEIRDEVHFCHVCGEKTDTEQNTAHPVYVESNVRNYRNMSYQPPRIAPIAIKPNPYGGFTLFSVLLSVAVLVFLLFPLVPGNYSNSYGNNGFGVFAVYFDLLGKYDASTNNFLTFIYACGMVMLIVSLLLSVAGAIVNIIIVGRAGTKRVEPNFKMLRVFAIVLISAMSLMLVISIAKLTFSFITALIASLYILLITLRPQFCKDAFKRKNNAERNNSALLLMLASIIFILCFTPVYNLRFEMVTEYGLTTRYLKVNLFQSFVIWLSGEAFTNDAFSLAFVHIIPVIVFVFAALNLILSGIGYLRKTGAGFKRFTAISIIQTVVLLLIGIAALVINKGDNTFTMSMTFWFYLLAAAGIVCSIVRLIIWAADDRVNKQSAEAKPETTP